MAYAATQTSDLDIDAIIALNESHDELAAGDTVIAGMNQRTEKIATVLKQDEDKPSIYRLASGGLWRDRLELILVAKGDEPIPVIQRETAGMKVAHYEPYSI